MKEKLTIVKVGGAIVEEEAQLHQLVSAFSRIEGPKILVHGGGRRATAVASLLGVENRMVEGRRVTDRQMLDVVTMVYGGLVNKRIVALLQSAGTDAIGLTGADGAVIRSHRRPLVTMSNGEQVDFGYVGDVDRVDGAKIGRFIAEGLVPVIAPLTLGDGTLLNTNADTMAQETAKAMVSRYDVTLIYAFEKAGVLADAASDSSVIPSITRRDFDRLKSDGTISGGMIPKVENALRAVDAGVLQVIITSAQAIDGRHGTVIN